VNGIVGRTEIEVSDRVAFHVTAAPVESATAQSRCDSVLACSITGETTVHKANFAGLGNFDADAGSYIASDHHMSKLVHIIVGVSRDSNRRTDRVDVQNLPHK